MTITPTQAKIGLAAIAALLAWLLGRKALASAGERAAKTLDVVINVDSPYFGMTDEEVAAAKAAGARANPAIDPKMRELIDRSSGLIAEDDASE